MKKVLSFVLCISLCIIYTLPVSAVEMLPKEDVIEKEEISVTSSSNYYSKPLPTLSSINGTASRVATFTTGSISDGMQITSISLNIRVSTGCDPFMLYIQAPYGTIYSFNLTKGGNITVDDFNGCDPSGSWKIWIETQGTVSKIDGTIKVCFSY